MKMEHWWRQSQCQKCDKPPLSLLKGPQNTTTHKVSFTAHSKTALFIARTPTEVYFKRTFTSCISLRRVYFVACVCPQQTVVSQFMGHSVAAACNARIMKRRHRICQLPNLLVRICWVAAEIAEGGVAKLNVKMLQESAGGAGERGGW